MRWRRPPALSFCERICASCFFRKPSFQDDAGRRRIDVGLRDAPLAQSRLARRLEPRLGLERRVALIDQLAPARRSARRVRRRSARAAPSWRSRSRRHYTAGRPPRIARLPLAHQRIDGLPARHRRRPRQTRGRAARRCGSRCRRRRRRCGASKIECQNQPERGAIGLRLRPSAARGLGAFRHCR